MGIPEAVKKTIDYSRQYGGYLTLAQLKERLISGKVYEGKKIENQLSAMPADYQLSVKKQTNRKLKRAERLVKEHLVTFGDILMVGVTGSVAAGYPKKEDDIDLLVVTKRKRLWLTRLWLRIYIKLKEIPHRAYREKEKKDQFCFNLWLTEDSLQIPRERQRLRAAMDLVMMKVVLNRENIYEKMIQQNEWAKKYVATGYQRKSDKLKVESRKLKVKRMGDVINWLVFWPQYWYMKGKIENEIIDMDRAFFNR